MGTDPYALNPYALAGFGAPLPKVATAIITPAQFLAMDNTFANGVLLAPSPGVGNAVLIEELYLNMQYGGTPYATGTGTLQLASTTGLFPIDILTSTDIKASASRFSVTTRRDIYLGDKNAAVGGGFQSDAWYIVLANSTKYTAGNSTFLAICRYRIVPMK